MPSLASREQLLHRLGQHVRGRVAQDVAAVGGVDRDRLDLVAVGELVGEVAQLAVRPGPRSPAASLGEQLPGLGARRHRTLVPLACVDDGDLDLGHGMPTPLAGLPAGRPTRSPASRPPTARPRVPRGHGACGLVPDRRFGGRSCGSYQSVPHEPARSRQGRLPGARRPVFQGGRYWVRTSDLFGVNEARYHCANRPVVLHRTCGAPERLAHPGGRFTSRGGRAPSRPGSAPSPSRRSRTAASRRTRRSRRRHRPPRAPRRR